MDQLETPIPYRKRMFPPETGFAFTRVDKFKEYDGVSETPNHSYADYSSTGNLIPRKIFDYTMIDENVFRI